MFIDQLTYATFLGCEYTYIRKKNIITFMELIVYWQTRKNSCSGVNKFSLTVSSSPLLKTESFQSLHLFWIAMIYTTTARYLCIRSKRELDPWWTNPTTHPLATETVSMTGAPPSSHQAFPSPIVFLTAIGTKKVNESPVWKAKEKSVS